MLNNRFYKKGYLIAVYDASEHIIAICDNTQEFAEYFKMPLDLARPIVHKIASGKQNTFRFNDENFTIALIPLDPKEIEELIRLEKADTA